MQATGDAGFVVSVVTSDHVERENIRSLLEKAGYTVCGYPTGDSFLDRVEATSTGCVLLDPRVLAHDERSIVDELRLKGCRMPVALLSERTSPCSRCPATDSGRMDVVVTPSYTGRLLAVVDYLTRQAGRLQASAEKDRQAKILLASLTRRERDVMEGMLQGLQNKQIARTLGISHRTVEVHRARVMHKAQANNLLELSRVMERAEGTSSQRAARESAGNTPAVSNPISTRACLT